MILLRYMALLGRKLDCLLRIRCHHNNSRRLTFDIYEELHFGFEESEEQLMIT